MMHRARYIAPSTRAMLLTSLLAACGSYDNPSKGPATGGAPSTGGVATGGAATGGATGGTATGGVATGGAMPTGGAAPNGGEATNGGSGGGEGGTSGGSDGKGACVDAAACGGDPVGTWMSQSCEIAIGGMTDLAAVGIGCRTAAVTGSVTVTGGFTVTADGMYTDATTTKGTAVIELEKACLEVSGFGTTCDRIGLETIGLNQLACVDNAQTMGCTCTATIDQPGNMAWIVRASSMNPPEGIKGTYSAADNKLVTTTEFGDETEYSYCVAGDTMTVTPITPSNVGSLTGPIVLKKQ